MCVAPSISCRPRAARAADDRPLNLLHNSPYRGERPHSTASCSSNLKTKMAAPTREKVQELIAEKDSIEREIKELYDVLESVSVYDRDALPEI